VNPAAGRKLAAGAGLAAVVYGLWVRPRLMRWGATDDEATGPYPGAGIVPEGERAGTMAVTIEAPPGEVWPRLVQMGWNRGGWYSWDASTTPAVPAPRKSTPSGKTSPSATTCRAGHPAASWPRGRWQRWSRTGSLPSAERPCLVRTLGTAPSYACA
jgi:hypothetical protein